MHIEFLVEEPSAQAALEIIVPKIVGNQITFDIHPYSGKSDLLRKLPVRMKGFAAYLPENHRIVVLIDRDNDDCKELKQKLELIAANARLPTKSKAEQTDRIRVVNRIVIEELEAWFFGDPEALRQAYPRMENLSGKKLFRDPDAIKGGTCERLEQELQRAGYHPSGLPKIQNARNIATYMNPDNNSSKSFRMFRDALRMLVQQQP